MKWRGGLGAEEPEPGERDKEEREVKRRSEAGGQDRKQKVTRESGTRWRGREGREEEEAECLPVASVACVRSKV